MTRTTWANRPRLETAQFVAWSTIPKQFKHYLHLICPFATKILVADSNHSIIMEPFPLYSEIKEPGLPVCKSIFCVQIWLLECLHEMKEIRKCIRKTIEWFVQHFLNTSTLVRNCYVPSSVIPVAFPHPGPLVITYVLSLPSAVRLTVVLHCPITTRRNAKQCLLILLGATRGNLGRPRLTVNTTKRCLGRIS